MQEKNRTNGDRTAIGGEETRGLSGGARGIGGTNQSSHVSLANGKVWDALRSPLRLQLFESIWSCPGTDARVLAQNLKTSAPRLHYHLKILLEAGLIGLSEESGRRGRRGPAGMTYCVAHDPLPSDFYDADPTAVSRRGTLLRELADVGLRDTPPDGVLAHCTSDFRHEALSLDELEQIAESMARIRLILSAARSRRHQERALAPATAFVGVCLAPLNGTSFPHGLPHCGDGASHNGVAH